MGRRKLTIQRLENMRARQAKFSKRKTGILKKAKELAILCDIDVALLLFSPTGKPSLHVGHNKELSAVVERLSKVSFEEREERRAYTRNLLKSVSANFNSEAEQRSFSLNRINDVFKLHENQLKELKEKLAQKTKILRDWKNPENIGDLSQLKIMEDHLVAFLNRIRNNKSQIVKELQLNSS